MNKVAALLLLAVTASANLAAAAEPVAAAAYDRRAGYQTPEELIEYARQYQRVKQQLLSSGYVEQGCDHQPLYYLVQPKEPVFLAQKVQCVFNTPARNNSLQTEYAHVTVPVFYDQTALLYREGKVTVEYSTVY